MVSAAKIETMSPVAKGRATDMVALAEAEASPGDALFDAVLFPNRSLPNAGFAMVMAIIVSANLIWGVFFFALGAWPVIGFCGLDVFLVWLAFKISYRQGRLRERIRLTQNALWVSRVLPSGHEARWRLQPYWTRVSMDDPPMHESQLRLISKGETLIVGAFLSPPERGALATALREALEKGRAR